LAVHGDPDAAAAFADLIRVSLHFEAHVAQYREVVSLA
jgi:hypothetical protein